MLPPNSTTSWRDCRSVLQQISSNKRLVPGRSMTASEPPKRRAKLSPRSRHQRVPARFRQMYKAENYLFTLPANKPGIRDCENRSQNTRASLSFEGGGHLSRERF
jgi:hypothetical protein